MRPKPSFAGLSSSPEFPCEEDAVAVVLWLFTIEGVVVVGVSVAG